MPDPVQSAPLRPVPAHHDVAPPKELSEKEQAEYDRVLAHFANPDYVLPGVDPEKGGALMEEERMWLSYECLLRYIRATKGDTSVSIKRLEATLSWRRDFGLYSMITPEHVEPEAVTGKMFMYGHDTQGRPLVYCCPSKQNTEESQRQVHFTYWTIERALELMGPGVESVTLMVDFADKTMGPSFFLARQLLHIIQTHYPERLGAAIVGHSPWLLHAFWKLIIPLMDPVTRSKFVFNPVSDDTGLWRSTAARDQGEANARLFARNDLISEGWSGSIPFTYEHEVYWPALLVMCENRRNEMTRVWRELGGVVGIREWDVKIGVQNGAVEGIDRAL